MWDPPPYYTAYIRDSPDLAHESDLSDAMRVCAERNIALALPSATETLVDEHFQQDIKGTRPRLAHCLFYQSLLVAGISLYPPEFVRKSGLKTIMLVDKLHYSTQPRKAVPVFRTGTLYLDPAPEVIAYLQDVFHHEYFHMIDTRMAEEGLFVSRRSRQDKIIDPEWEALNVLTFRYGSGGSRNRQPDGFIGMGSVERGFLNSYSMTAVEEDKAEVFAGLIRHPGAMFEAADPILKAKSLELARRLVLFCPAMNEHFWKHVAAHEPYPIKSPSEHGQWETATSHEGYPFWVNKKTNHTSWINPTLKKEFSQPLPAFLRPRRNSTGPPVNLKIVIDPPTPEAAIAVLSGRSTGSSRSGSPISPLSSSFTTPPTRTISPIPSITTTTPTTTTTVRGDTTTTILKTKRRSFVVETVNIDEDDFPPIVAVNTALRCPAPSFSCPSPVDRKSVV